MPLASTDSVGVTGGREPSFGGVNENPPVIGGVFPGVESDAVTVTDWP